MDADFIFGLGIDTSKGHKDLDILDKRAKQVFENQKQLIETIEEKSKKSFNEVLTMARAGWMATQAIVKASGGTISTMFASTIQMAFSMVAILTPLLTAKAAAGDYLSAALGFAEIMATLMATGAAMGQQLEAEQAAREAMAIINSVGILLGSMSFLW